MLYFPYGFYSLNVKKDYGVANQAIKPNGSYNIMGALPLPHIYIQNPVPKVTTRINLQL